VKCFKGINPCDQKREKIQFYRFTKTLSDGTNMLKLDVSEKVLAKLARVWETAREDNLDFFFILVVL